MAEEIMRKREHFITWYKFYMLGLKNKKARRLYNSLRDLERE